MKIKYLLSCSLLAGGALFASCTSIEPKLDNDYKPLLPEEIPEGTITQLNYGELRAFPGAEGHGRDVTGGRGGKVYHVTSLEDGGDGDQGTFRWAVRQSGARTIVFDVAGTIHLKKALKIEADNITIAGQTSPGGICIADQAFTIAANNVIIRFMRFRPGNPADDVDGLGGMDRKNIIVDHCSVSWSSDETLSVYGMENSTVQWCIASQALYFTQAKDGKAHGFAGNWGGHNATYHHNLIAHCDSRTPRLGPRPSTLELGEQVDIRNNVFYNWGGEGCYGGETQHANLVNNYYKPGPTTDLLRDRRCYRIARIGIYGQNYDNGEGFEPFKGIWGRFYIDGNYMFGNADVTADNWTDGVYAQQEDNDGNDYTWESEGKSVINNGSQVVNVKGVTTHTAQAAYDQVLKYVGACNYRDNYDKFIMDEVAERKATCNIQGNNHRLGYINHPSELVGIVEGVDENGYPVLVQVADTDLTDTDGDGIPDYWETQYGLNKDYAADGNLKTVDENGEYTNLEMYLNSLVQDIMDKCREGGTVVE